MSVIWHRQTEVFIYYLYNKSTYTTLMIVIMILVMRGTLLITLNASVKLGVYKAWQSTKG